MQIAHRRIIGLRQRRARGLLAAFALVACCAAFTLSNGTHDTYAALLRSCRQTGAQPYLGCVSAAVLEYSYLHPRAAGGLLRYVFEHGRDGGERVDLRPLSETAHYVGMELSVLPLTLRGALEDCGDAFKAACVHGYVMERLDRDRVPRSQLVRRFLGFCVPLQADGDAEQNCLHAVGHELWARTRLSLEDTLALCDTEHRAADLTACWSGVLMEYSKGQRAAGHHSHEPAGKVSLPCASLAARFREVCVYAEASYRQYIPGWEPPRITYERCGAAPPAYRLGCMTQVSERLEIAAAGSPRLADSACAQLDAGRATCYRSMSQLRN